MNGIERLLELREVNNAKGFEMQLEAPRFLQLAQRHINGTAPQAIIGFNLFQTPRIIAARMADIIRDKITTGTRILEPSAGLGRLVFLEQLRADWVMVEEAKECINALVKMFKQERVKHRDFLTTTAEELGGKFDAVIMNPPFKMGRDTKHIQHAAAMLKPGGRLVSLCYNGTRQNKELKPITTTWEVLPEGSFKEEGTNASIAMLTINK